VLVIETASTAAYTPSIASLVAKQPGGVDGRIGELLRCRGRWSYADRTG
jgi:hypothetical protein